MGRYCIKSREVKVIKKLLKNFGTINVDNKDVYGKIIIKNFRKYNFGVEVDVIFEGKALFKYNGKKQFLDSSLLKQNVSKIRVKRIIKKYLLDSTKMRMRFFDLDLRWYSDIKNLTWK